MDVKLTAEQIRIKIEDLKKVREALNMKYQQIGGQIELLTDMLEGRFGDKK